MIACGMQDETIVREFTGQAESFNTSQAARATESLDELITVAGPERHERWLEAACGPGLISRRLAPLVREVHGIDLTPAMVEVARREAARAGVGNARFSLGDATATGLAAGSFDGAVARFALHHLPVPGRLFEELARVVLPGGKVVLADHLADERAEALAWSQEIERLRDPSHWACLPASRLRALGERAGLELELERVLTLELDFDDWLTRGSGGRAAPELVEQVLHDRPAGTECFQVRQLDARRVLRLRMWLSRWRRA